jgi:hypothetical protein
MDSLDLMGYGGYLNKVLVSLVKAVAKLQPEVALSLSHRCVGGETGQLTGSLPSAANGCQHSRVWCPVQWRLHHGSW